MTTIFQQATKRDWRWLAMCLLFGLAAHTAHAQGTFNSGSTGADGAFNPTQNQMVQLPESGVFNYTTVNIPAGVTITYKRNSRNTPVTILASGNVTIAGTIDVSGGTGNSSTIPTGVGGLGGPGGFDGGRSATVFPSFAVGIGGNGPGGGGGSPGPDSSGTINGGGGGHAVNGGGGANGAAGIRYGTRTLLPLVGGSGGGGGGGSAFGYGGGGGGGAILIASSGTITIGTTGAQGRILSRGGTGYSSSSLTGDNLAPASHCTHGGGGGGAGGAIRLIASAITGNATLDVSGGTGGVSFATCGDGGYGYVRLEAFNITNFTFDNSPKVIDAGLPGLVTLANTPTLRIASVGGVNAPATPAGSLHTAPDISLPSSQANPVTVTLQAANIPLGKTIEVRLTPPTGTPTSVQSTPLTGSVAASTATASLTLPTGQSLIYATASIDLTGSNSAQLKPIFIEGERVRKIEVGANFGGASDVVYVTESGRRVRLE